MKKNVLFLILGYSFPVVFSILYHLFKPINGIFGGAGVILVIIINISFVPIYMSVISYYLSKRSINYFVILFSGLVSIIASQYIQFWSWGVDAGRLNNPDWKTITIVQYELAISLSIFLVGMIIIGIKSFMKRKK